MSSNNSLKKNNKRLNYVRKYKVWSRWEREDVNTEGHHRKMRNRVVLWTLWFICYLHMGKWKPSLSLVKHDALPRPLAQRWLKFTLTSLCEWLAEAALTKTMGRKVTFWRPPQLCLIYLVFYHAFHWNRARERDLISTTCSYTGSTHNCSPPAWSIVDWLLNNGSCDSWKTSRVEFPVM